jgi:hypothetical protein
MVNIKLESGWFLIENKVLFWADAPHPDHVNLALEAGPDIVVERLPHAIIEYPGEYDIMWVWAKVLLWAENKLNYLLNLDGKKIWIIQTPRILEDDEVWDMDARLYMDESVEKKIDQLELWWKKIQLSNEGWVLDIKIKNDDNNDVAPVKASDDEAK